MWSLSPVFSSLSVVLALTTVLFQPLMVDARDPNSKPTDFWPATIKRQGTVAYSNKTSAYEIFRNVKHYGAKGDGKTDDTKAIQNAIVAGGRCAECMTTVNPAIVYFPAGTYLVSSPIQQYYYTEFLGDALHMPTIKASKGFTGSAVIDANPTDESGNIWYTPLDNFYRQVRNFVIDVTETINATAVHWEVSQAATLQNIVFEMAKGSEQTGLTINQGAGGLLTDLVFNGGRYGAIFGNQQFTMRNLTFNDCNTAISMNWGWAWSFKSLSINRCQVGLNLTQISGESIGSIVVSDSLIHDTPIGVVTPFNHTSLPVAEGSLILDNVQFSNSPMAVGSSMGNTILKGNQMVELYLQGNLDTSFQGHISSHFKVQGQQPAIQKPLVLLDNDGRVFEKSKPQFSEYPAARFFSVKSLGAKGDGFTDDTTALQAIFNDVPEDAIVYFDHGAYVVSDTIAVPKNIKLTGEIWPLIMAKGDVFQNQSDPKPVFKVGNPGDQGTVQMTDLIFETVGPQPGAIMIEWNVRGIEPGASGMWDVHVRVGGSAGTRLQSDKCAAQSANSTTPSPDCEGAFLLLHVTKEASVYLENVWLWTADHELDLADHASVDVFTGRGMLIESTEGPVWMYATASEHSALYNYQIANASSIYMSIIQTESPYYQPAINSLIPFTPQARYQDPDFASCTTLKCQMSWSLRVLGSSNIIVHGAALWAFFNDWDVSCYLTHSCQSNSVLIENSQDVYLFGLTTIGMENLLLVDGGQAVATADENLAGDTNTLALFAGLGLS